MFFGSPFNYRLLFFFSSNRYFKFMIQVDHPSTFSVKNLNMIVVGIFVLIILVATGPLYGLGEYSYYRGTHTKTVIRIKSECLT